MARKSRGFTLIELVTVLIVGSILTAIAIPSFSRLIANMRVRTASTNIYLAMMQARSEAIKRSTPITITPNTAGHWEDGWQITCDAAIPAPACSAANVIGAQEAAK